MRPLLSWERRVGGVEEWEEEEMGSDEYDDSDSN